MASSLALLDAARRGVQAPVLARIMLALGVAATLGANAISGAGHGPVGIGVAVLPAAAFIGSVEVLLAMIRGRVQPVPETTREAVADVASVLNNSSATHIYVPTGPGNPIVTPPRPQFPAGYKMAPPVSPQPPGDPIHWARRTGRCCLPGRARRGSDRPNRRMSLHPLLKGPPGRLGGPSHRPVSHHEALSFLALYEGSHGDSAFPMASTL